jgi:hypothetical protein
MTAVLPAVDQAEQRRIRILNALTRELWEMDLPLTEELRLRLTDAVDDAVEPAAQGTDVA